MTLLSFANRGGKILVRPERFELPTYCSGGNRSIHLSYGRALTASVYYGRLEKHQCKYCELKEESKQASQRPKIAARLFCGGFNVRLSSAARQNSATVTKTVACTRLTPNLKTA
jgi:hypothetical protein